MKRTIAILLALILLFGAALPAFAGDRNTYLAGETSLAKIGKLTITTDGKSKQLVLQWSAVPRADGYQILRSTTGKTGSYKAIADEGGTTYTDKGLKNSTAYYYAVRAYAWNGSRTIYSPYKKANLSTRITKTYAVGRFTQAYKAMNKFQNAYDKNDYERGKAIEAEMMGWYGFYMPFKLKGCTTKADVVVYLSKYIEKQTAKEVVSFFLKTINGRLYIWKAQDPGMSETLIINDITARKLSYSSDKKVSCKFGTWFSGPDGDNHYYSIKLKLLYQNGSWVFAEDSYWYSLSYPYTTEITPNDGK